jgi:hypothetical protein
MASQLASTTVAATSPRRSSKRRAPPERTRTPSPHKTWDFGEMFRNQVLNLSEDRIAVIQAVFERRSMRSY